ncbi:MAG: hypothetical protein U0264_05190 [Candidatus Kapaibacterium sp.]
MPDNLSPEDRAAENKRYYDQNRERILAQRRDNRKIYMRNYRLLMKVKSQLKKSKKRTT